MKPVIAIPARRARPAAGTRTAAPAGGKEDNRNAADSPGKASHQGSAKGILSLGDQESYVRQCQNIGKAGIRIEQEPGAGEQQNPRQQGGAF